jgi:hypothetical protein
VNRCSTAIFRSATKLAHSACPIFEKVHEPTAIVVHHHAGADPSGPLVDLASCRNHHPAWLVAGNDRALELAKPKRRGFSSRGAIKFEIAAAHSGRFDFDHHVMGPGRRIGKLGDLQFAPA